MIIAYLPHYLLVVLLSVVIDLIWIRIIADRFYREQLGNVYRTTAGRIPALLFFVFMSFALTVFAIIPGLETGSFGRAVSLGALLGFTAYMTCDLTNLAVVNGWTRNVAVVNILWGTFLWGSIAAITYAAGAFVFV